MKRLNPIVLSIFLCGCGPCGPIPGGTLSGDVQARAPADWASTIHENGYCQIEVNPPDPYSFTANCFVHEGELHVGSMRAPEKKWPVFVAEDPNVRVRFGNDIYLRRAVKIIDEGKRQAVFQSKFPGDDKELDETIYLYRLEPREGA